MNTTKRELSICEIVQIKWMRQEGFSLREIAIAFGRQQETIKNILKT